MPKRWVFLVIAIVSEVFANASLRAGIDDPLWNLGSVVGYSLGFLFLGLALREGMAVGSAYAIWGALGVVLTSFIGVFVFAEPLSVLNWVGMAAIVIGVVMVEARTGEPAEPSPEVHS